MGRENPVVVSQVRASHGEHTIVAEVHAAPGQDLTLWRTGWSPAAGVAQAQANKETLHASWAVGGTAPMHIIQAAAVGEDVLEFLQK